MKSFKITLFAIIICSLAVFFACNTEKEDDQLKNDSLAKIEKSEIPEIKAGNFYTENSEPNKAVVLADTIVYYTVIKNPDPEDDWQEKCLSRLNRKALANIVFNAIYNGRLTAYDFMTEQPMTIEEVKALEKEHPRKDIAKMEFTEEWFFDENSLSFVKKVNSIMMGYEQRNRADEVKYFAGVKVYLDGNIKNTNKAGVK